MGGADNTPGQPEPSDEEMQRYAADVSTADLRELKTDERLGELLRHAAKYGYEVRLAGSVQEVHGPGKQITLEYSFADRLRAAEEERDDGDDLLYLAHVRHGELVAERDRLADRLRQLLAHPRLVGADPEGSLALEMKLAREALASLEQKGENG